MIACIGTPLMASQVIPLSRQDRKLAWTVVAVSIKRAVRVIDPHPLPWTPRVARVSARLVGRGRHHGCASLDRRFKLWEEDACSASTPIEPAKAGVSTIVRFAIALLSAFRLQPARPAVYGGGCSAARKRSPHETLSRTNHGYPFDSFYEIQADSRGSPSFSSS